MYTGCRVHHAIRNDAGYSELRQSGEKPTQRGLPKAGEKMFPEKSSTAYAPVSARPFCHLITERIAGMKRSSRFAAGCPCYIDIPKNFSRMRIRTPGTPPTPLTTIVALL